MYTDTHIHTPQRKLSQIIMKQEGANKRLEYKLRNADCHKKPTPDELHSELKKSKRKEFQCSDSK